MVDFMISLQGFIYLFGFLAIMILIGYITNRENLKKGKELPQKDTVRITDSEVKERTFAYIEQNIVSQELKKEALMSYQELSTYLQRKYGLPSKPYFTNENCYTKSKINSRANEGLFIHHIKEDEEFNLSNEEVALINPFEYQLPYNLCYCNYIEHMLLHMKIVFNANSILSERNKYNALGIRGLLLYIVPQINVMYKGKVYKKTWKNKAFEVIRENEEDYKKLLVAFKYRYLNTKYKCSDATLNYEINNITKIYKIGKCQKR